MEKCRTCLSSDDNMESLNIDLLIDSKFMPIPNIIYLCTGVHITKRESNSSLICRNCIEAVIIAYKYRLKCWESHMIYLGMAKKRDRNIVIDDNPSQIIQDIQIQKRDNKKEINNYSITPLSRASYPNIKNRIPRLYRDMTEYVKISEEQNCIRPFICVKCNTSYIGLQALRKHLINRHSVMFQTKYRCNICFKYFVHKKLLMAHHGRHHRLSGIRNICHHCGKNFNSESTLKIHLRRHTGYKPFKCSECPYRSVSSTDLAIHTRSHTGEKPFKCHVCDKQFKTSSYRAIHIRQNHSDERPYKCVVCPKTFKSNSAYKLHMARHNPTKLVECPECNKMFKERKSLFVHMKGHRPPTCKCPVCDKKFTHKHNLNVHIRTVHKNNIPMSQECELGKRQQESSTLLQVQQLNTLLKRS